VDGAHFSDVLRRRPRRPHILPSLYYHDSRQHDFLSFAYTRQRAHFTGYDSVGRQAYPTGPPNPIKILGGSKHILSIVGLADKAVAESRERVRSAFAAIGLQMPYKRIVVNLAPADLPKEGAHYDLPIALGIMAAMGALPPDALHDFAAMGELSLDGTIAPVPGALPAAVCANSLGLGLICPEPNGAEAAWAGDLSLLAPHNLVQLINHFKGTQLLPRPAQASLCLRRACLVCCRR